ncbi:MAG TPA: DUF1015 domain-containing protein [Solirubrobacterales bacterium]|nr:DUF1015 domain-containing protein [Solirubrobacterales bacterium]HMU28029.1 DUF1015 domain-containing protein [Solirubrobacterales bacterium]HMW45014.1 DUF1015 domain-containing protein [Solirubrobacterales bacterium]HMY25556.1 DUF1015 domain-containing protein [Solirubrobacterales bacterium]HNA23135.1 DUF1015 domain-containing protein [Solirubrobacterales bacterium]
MADIRPLHALHYDLRAIGSLGEVAAPPYDVISGPERSSMLDTSPFNVVEIDLPESTGGDPYEHASGTLEEWILSGILKQDREPSIWALTQEFTGPDGSMKIRNAILARVRVEDYGPGRIRPHERTQPGPKQDRLDLTRATRYNLSPIFSLTTRDAWPVVAPAIEGEEAWAEVLGGDGTLNRVWKIEDPEIHRAVSQELDQAELLIADGHHRYETARAYRDEVGGEGAHCYTLMALTGLDDPGLTVFPTHRLLTGLKDPDLVDRLKRGVEGAFESIAEGEIDPSGVEGTGCFGLALSDGSRQLLRLRDPASLNALFPDESPAFRDLDAAILEKVVLGGVLGMTETDVEAKRGLAYAKTIGEATAAVDSGEAQAAFILRATPIGQVRAVAEAGETMPPKSTYFFPKIPTGIVFNPLS